MDRLLTSGELRAAYDAMSSHAEEILRYLGRVMSHCKEAGDMEVFSRLVDWNIRLYNFRAELLRMEERIDASETNQ